MKTSERINIIVNIPHDSKEFLKKYLGNLKPTLEKL